MKPIKHIVWIIFVIGLVAALIVFWLQANYKLRRGEILSTEQSQVATQYSYSIYSYRLVSKTLYDEVINQPEILNLIKNGQNSSLLAQERIKNSLYDRFQPVYERLKAKNFKQLALYGVDGRDVLNMYQPDNSGETSSIGRYSIQQSCGQGQYMEGFEEGRLFNAFRYIFPISDGEDKLGCVETSVSFGTFEREMSNIFPLAYKFILKKNIVDDQIFSNDVRHFQVSSLNKDYYEEIETLPANQVPNVFPEQIEEINKALRSKVKLKMEKEYEFAEDVSIGGDNYIVVFIPIHNIAKEQVVYLVAYHKLDSIFFLKNDLYLRIVMALALMFVLLFLVYYVYESQQKQLEAGERLKNITAAMNEGLMVVNKTKEIVFFNPAASIISGFAVEEIIGKPFVDGLKFVFEKGDKSNDQFLDDVLKKSTTIKNSKDIYIMQKSGDRLPVLVSAAPLNSGKGEVIGCIIVFRDITQEREVDRAKTEFVSLASHQLKTPLSAINWYAEMLMDGEAGPLTERQVDFLKEIANGNSRMVKLVNSLLNVSRIDMGTISVIPEPVDLRVLTDSVIAEQQFFLQEKRQTLDKIYDSKLPIIALDPNLMRIVMQNLVSNAIKYTREGGHIDVELTKKDSINAYIRVADNGYGIPKSQQPEIFKKLFRADNVKSKKVEGTGLGLYVAKAVIEAFGGKIWFESVEDKGTTFHILLPLAGAKKVEGSKGLEGNT